MKLKISLFLLLAALALTGVSCNQVAPAQPASPTPLAVSQGTVSVQTALSTPTTGLSQPEAVSTQTATDSQTVPAASPTARKTPRRSAATRTPGATATPASTSTGSTSASTPQCTTLLGLHVRSGPGEAYAPPITSVEKGTVLTPLGFNPNGVPGGRWVYVSSAAGFRGWVSAGDKYVDCNVEFSTLAFFAAPPLPPTSTPTSTAGATSSPTSQTIAAATDTPIPPTNAPVIPTDTPTPTNTPQSPPIVSNPDPNGQCEDPVICEEPQFTSATLFRVTARVGEEAADGDGIAQVSFFVEDSNGTQIHSFSDTTAAFCFFGGDGPCNTWPLVNGQYAWGFGGPAVQSGTYTIKIRIVPSDPNLNQGFWEFGNFTVTVP